MRARNIKPGFFENELLAKASYEARLLFIALWLQADRSGRLEDRPARIRALAFAYGDHLDVDKLLDELAGLLEESGDPAFILRYTGEENRRYIQVVHFEKHQTPHCKEKASTIPAPDKHSACTVQVPYLHPLNDERGIMKDERGTPGADAPCPSKAGPSPAEFLIAWNASAKASGWPVAKSMTDSRKRALRSRLKDPSWVASWKAALERAGQSVFLGGQNDRGWRMDVDFFLRPDSVTKIIEGKYDGNGKTGGADADPLADMSDAELRSCGLDPATARGKAAP